MKTARLLVYILLAAGLFLRLYDITGQSMWRDEIDALRFAREGAVLSLAQPGWNGPLYNVILGRWLALTGTSEFALRLSSLLAGALLVPLTWKVAVRLFTVRAAVIAAAYTAFSPYLVWYSQELKMYALLATLGALSYLLLLEALAKGRWWRWVVYVLATSVIPYVHVMGALLIPAQALGVMALWPDIRYRWRSFIGSLALMILPYVPLALWQMPLFLSAFQTGHPFYPFPRILSTLGRSWSAGILAAQSVWLFFPFVAATLALALPATAIPSRRRGATLFLLAWVLVPITLVYLVSLRTPLFADRYLVALVPAVYLLLARGTDKALALWKPLGLVLLASLLLVQSYQVRQQSRYSIKADTRGAAGVIEHNWQAGDVVVPHISYLSYSLDYYLGPEYPLVAAPYTDGGMTMEEVDSYFRAHLAGARRVWLLLSESEMWDGRGLVRQWFRGNAEQIERWEFAREELLLFEPAWR